MLPAWVVAGQARHEGDVLEARGGTGAPSTTRQLRLRLRNDEAHGARPALSELLRHPWLLAVLLLLLLVVEVVRVKGKLEAAALLL